MMEDSRADGTFDFYLGNGVWFNAYILKLLNYAKDEMYINDYNIKGTKTFLSGHTLGADPKPFPGLAKSGVPLEAYVVIAFTEAGRKSEDDAYLNEALTYITNGPISSDNYTLAISAYALALNNHSKTNDYLNKLMSPWTQADIESNEMISWTNPGNNLATRIETAAYAILALARADRYKEAAKAFKYLMTQRNSFGGFSKTQDTVVGIQALTCMTKHFKQSDTSMNIEMKDASKTKTFKIDANNAKNVQKEPLDSKTRSVTISASGSGVVYFQIAYNFSATYAAVNEGGLTSEASATRKSGETSPLVVESCATLSSSSKTETGMALIEVEVPSGYVFNRQMTESYNKAKQKSGSESYKVR